MPLEASILKSTKKILGLAEGYTEFDLDVLTHINTSFFNLQQLGIGPPGGFSIEDDSSTWQEFIEPTGLSINAVRTYVWLKVRSYFDPPGTPHHLAAQTEQLSELEHRLKMERELAIAGAPSLPPGLETDPYTGTVIIQGGDLDD